MSTWNPYRVMLMNAKPSYAPWPYIICAVIVLAQVKGYLRRRRYCKI
jgi:hypothetical protein